jgi:AcrR family transcriptional regulator
MVEERRVRGAGLTRKKVLASALEIADAEGLKAVSFRRLATHLKVTPMALYRYVESKEALLDGLGDLILAELELPPSQPDDWREQLRTTARSLRSVLTAHPAVVPLLLTRSLLTPAAMRTADSMLGLLRRAGFAPQEAVLLYQQLARLLLALVMLENESGSQPTDAEQREKERIARITFETLSPDEYPHVVEAAPHLASVHDPAEAFEAGVDLLIGGLARRLEGTTSST